MLRRRWRIAGVLLLVLSVGALAYAAGQSKAPRPRVAEVLRARSFEAVDAKGRVAVRLRVEPDGFVWLSVTNGTGRSRAVLQLNSEGLPRLAVMDRAGLIRGSVLITPDGYSACHLDDRNEKTRVDLMAGADGSNLNVNDGQEVLRAGLVLHSDGAVTAALSGADGRPAAAIHVNAQDFPHFGLLRDKQPIWEAP